MGGKRKQLKMTFLSVLAALLITSICFVSPAMAAVYRYTMDSGNFGGVFLSDESYTNYATDETKQIISQAINPTDGSTLNPGASTIMTNVGLRPVFEIWITRNSMKTPDQIIANEAKIHLQTEDSSQDIAITYQAINSTYRYYCIQPVENLAPSTTYRIFVDNGIQLGSTVTQCEYIAKFTTKDPDPAWPDGTEPGITNLGANNLTLNWPQAVSSSFTEYYKVYQDGNYLDTLGSDSKSYNVDSLTPNTSYNFDIKAFDRNNNERGSLTVNVTTGMPEANPDTEAPVWIDKTLAASGIKTSSVTLSWSGAGDNVGVTGYKILKDGQLLTKNIESDKSSYTVTGLTDGTTYKFKVEARDALANWSTNGPELTVRTAYTLGKKAALSEGSPVYYQGGIAITPQNLESNNNAVTVRDAFGEIPYNHASEERPLEWSMLYYANLKNAGGYYGLNFAADGAAVNDVMTITLPITDAAKLADDKVGVYMLDWFWEDPARQFIAHTWKKLDATIDKENATATVTVTGGNQDIILGVLSNTYGPDGISLTASGRTDDPSITLDIICNSAAGLSQIGIKKEKYVSMSSDPIVTNFVLKNTEDHQYITAVGSLDNYECTYIDTDVELGAFYRYSADLAATFDALNNNPLTGNGSVRTVAGSDTTGLSSLKQLVTDGKEMTFAAGDSVASVTQSFTVSPTGPFTTTLWGISWSSDNTDVITIDGIKANVTRPEDNDTVVNLTATVTFYGLTDTVIIPVTVKQADTPYLTDLDTKILAGVAADTLAALKSSALGLANVRDALAQNYQTALKAARDTKGSSLNAAEIKDIIGDANDAADVAAAKASFAAHMIAGEYYDLTGEIHLTKPDYTLGVSVAWTAVNGPDANRVTLNDDGTATLNSLPAYGEAYGSITMTKTLTKGDAIDTVDYTFELRGREVRNYAVAYFTSNLITMSSDGVTPSDDYWYLQVTPYQDEDGTRWEHGTTIKDTIGHDDISITGLPEGLDYMVEKVGYNDVKITLTGTAVTAPIAVSDIGIVIKASAIEENNASDSNVFAAKLNPFNADVVIDYTPFSLTDALPWQDAKSHSNIGFTQFVRAAEVDAVNTITLNDPVYLFNEEDILDFADDPNHVIDLHGATIVAGFDGNDTTDDYRNYLLCTGTGPTVTLKNAVIDMNHKNFKTVFNAKGILHLENVSIINSENTDFGAMVWANNTKSYGNGTVNNEQFAADNCQFGNFKTAGVLQWTPAFVLSELLEANSRPSQVKLTDCIFDGGGQPGYGVVGCYGSIVIDDCTFTGYQGSVATGAAATSDYFIVPKKPTFYDYRLILPYKGIPDNSPSAAILLKEVTSAKSVSGNTISDCDNGILVWTGEQNFHQYDQRPVIGYTAYVKLNEANVLTTAEFAQDAFNYLVGENNITLASESSGVNVGIENAADRYNRVSLITGSDTTAIAAVNAAILAGDARATLAALQADTAAIANITAANLTQYQNALALAREAKGSALNKNEIQAVIDQVNAATIDQDAQSVAAVKGALIRDGLSLDLNSIGEIGVPSGAVARGVTAQWTAISGEDMSRITLSDGKATLTTQPDFGAANGSAVLTLTLSKGAAIDTLEYAVNIYPLGKRLDIIDYNDGEEDAAWTQFENACKNGKIKTIIINKPIGVGEAIKADKIPQIVFTGFSAEDNIIDCKGKTIKLGADMDYMLYSGEGKSITLKNAIIDLDGKEAQTAIMCSGAVKLQNVKFINGENVNCGITVPDAEMIASLGDRLILNDCNFGNFKLTAILESAAYPTCVSTGYNAVNGSDYDQYAGKTNASLTSAKLTDCTFNGNGEPGFGIVGCFETLTVKDCTFKGYNGAVSTGINWDNEVFDGNPYLNYKGIPDGTPSAAILLKEVATADISDNRILNCENGILIWTGEEDFRHYGTTPNSNWTGYVEANGVLINDADTAAEAYLALAEANDINLASKSDGYIILIENAADRYNRTELYTQHFTIGKPVIRFKEGPTENTEELAIEDQNSKLINSSRQTTRFNYKIPVRKPSPKSKVSGRKVTSLTQGCTYTMTVPLETIGDLNGTARAEIVLRGGDGAGAESGGTVIGQTETETTGSKPLTLQFTVPDDMTGKVYGSVIIWNSEKTVQMALPMLFKLTIK